MALFVLVGISALTLAEAEARQPRSQLMATVMANAPIYIEPKVLPIPLRTAAVGTRLEVLMEQGDWIQVRFGDPMLGPRVGWVQASQIRIERPELQPMDLSVPPPATTPPRTADPPRAPARPIDEDEEEEQEEPRDPNAIDRGWIDVSFGIALAAEDSYSVRVERTLFREPASFRADYRFPIGAALDFGGGVMLTRSFGVGVSISGTGHLDEATVTATVPHPFRVNLPDTDSADTDEELTRAEGAVHIQAVFAAMTSDRVRVRAFGGPSYFRVQQDTIDTILFFQVAPLLGSNTITITGTPFSETTGEAWGFHAGADVSVFFTRVVGVGGLVRYSRAEVELIDLLGELNTVTAGGLQITGGLRLKF